MADTGALSQVDWQKIETEKYSRISGYIYIGGHSRRFQNYSFSNESLPGISKLIKGTRRDPLLVPSVYLCGLVTGGTSSVCTRAGRKWRLGWRSGFHTIL